MLKEYLRTRVIYYVILVFLSIILIFIAMVFKLKLEILKCIIITSFVTMTILFTANYIAIENSFKRIRTKLHVVKKPELITYYLDRPNHFESGYLYDMLEQISDSLYKVHKKNIDNQLEYQDYLLLFVHDLKLPLQNLKLTATEEQLSEIKYLELQVDNLLNYSKVSLDTINIKVTNVKVDKLINKVLKNNFDSIIDKQITMKNELKATTITTDEYWLEFILKQLVNNAITYCDSILSIKIIETNDQVSIIIENDGVLIRNDELKSIFDKGYSGSNAKDNSTGYGLYYVQLVATKLNCTVEASGNSINSFKILFKNKLNTTY